MKTEVNYCFSVCDVLFPCCVCPEHLSHLVNMTIFGHYIHAFIVQLFYFNIDAVGIHLVRSRICTLKRQLDPF